MAMTIMEKLARENELLLIRNQLYGIKEGYHICSQYKDEGYVKAYGLRFSLLNLSVDDKEKIKQFVKQNKKELKLRGVTFKDNVVTIFLKVFPTRKDGLSNILNGIIAFFTENSFVSGCSLSQSNENIMFVDYKGQVMALSSQVVENLKLNDESSEVSNEDKSYFPGIVGAGIGGIIGMIPWILFAMVGYISSISGLAMGWLVKTGYEKAKGKKGGMQMGILIIVIILFTYLGIMASQMWFLLQSLMDQGYSLSQISIWELFKYVVVLPFTSEGMGYGLWGEILMGFFFAALGSVSFLRRAHESRAFSAGSQVNTNIQQPIQGAFA
ncbi:MAG: hypothetical protein JXN65_09180 [Clostridia bacterium]|nr:hypothetical protein [Clostridia bacterium]